jgi:hypothetical protein
MDAVTSSVRAQLPNPTLSRTLFVLMGLFSVVLLSSPPAWARVSHVKPAAVPGREYRAALSAADRFLHAWQSEDQETGLLMLSDSAKRRASEDVLSEFFASGTGAAYEIGRGKELKGGRYSFPVVLYFVAAKERRARARDSVIVVTHNGKDDWVVDRLP